MEQIFSNYKKLIDKEIDLLATDLQATNLPWSDKLAISLAQSAKLGKTVRGALILLTLDIFQQKINPNAVKVAAAIEYLHTALLIHDDIMDRDEKRRGQPSTYRQYEKIGTELGASQALNFGTSMAICLGDIAIFTAWWSLSKLTEINSNTYQRLFKLFSQEFLRVGFGQIQDVTFSHLPQIPSPEEVLTMYTNKTARYTFSLPFLTAGILSEQPESTMNVLSQLGLNLGLIFQLTDDSLTLDGDSQEVGKAIGNDIKENKKTLYHVLLRQRASSEDLQKISNIFGNPQATEFDWQLIRDLIIHYQVDQEISQQIQDYAKQSYQLINDLPIKPAAQKNLEQLVVYLINRRK